ncbi:YesL family protein [Halorhabdus amylolytica]|uniref:YesL family protein n=1 Tax=Halorhabdus amylolytica TaxID=2559573 RepID=UPI0010AA43F8|nr:YesL family protein [Halorhabdus amylolytica]
MSASVDFDSVEDALWPSFAFVYHNAVAVAVLSLAWFVASLPLVTIGPATIGLYAAVWSIREQGELDIGTILKTVRRHFVNATLLGGVVVIMAVTSFVYLARYVRTEGTPAALLGVGGLYVTIHLVLVFIPTFVALVQATPLSDAVKTSYHWTVTQPYAALATLVVTGVLLVVSLVLTVAFVLVFPALIAWFHTQLLEPLFTPEPEPVPADESRPSSASYSEPDRE